MSCNYAEGLSEYKNKGILGVAEIFDEEEQINEKCEELYKMMKMSTKTVVHTGAGISTSSGIPDFRGPQGVWTLEKKGEKPNINIAFQDAIPSKTHMALKALIEQGYIQYIVSQNIDGLHLKSGIDRKYLSELHGNMFIELCVKCRKEFIRNTPAPTVGQKPIDRSCPGGLNSRSCRGYLTDNILDWEHDLPDKDLDIATCQSTLADLNIALGTTLQIIPSGNLPLKNKKYGGKLVICNLQPTKHNKKADLIISTYVDVLMTKLLKKLGIELPEYDLQQDPTKTDPKDGTLKEWTIPAEAVETVEKLYEEKVKQFSSRKRSLLKVNDEDGLKKSKMKKGLVKKEENINNI